MPIYVYRCNDCSTESEVLQKLSAAAPDCPHCRSTKMVKQVTAAGFQLKGSGYYVTDFKNPAPAKTSAPPSAQGSSASSTTAPATATSSSASPPSDTATTTMTAAPASANTGAATTTAATSCASSCACH